MPTEHMNSGLSSSAHAQREAATNDGLHDESWALALMNECENMDRDALLRPSPVARYSRPERPLQNTNNDARDDAILVNESATESPSTTRSASAIEKQLAIYKANTSARLHAELDAQAPKRAWRTRILHWLAQ